MNIGIQRGTTAASAESIKLDKQVRQNAKRLIKEFEANPSIRFQPKLLKSQIPGGKGACAPDGGHWFYNDKHIAAFEAKKQGANGNAIERWFKNFCILRNVAPQISYVTFATGEGAKEGNVIQNTLMFAHHGSMGRFNAPMPGGNSCYLSPEGFDDQTIFNIMKEAINERIQFYEKQS